MFSVKEFEEMSFEDKSECVFTLGDYIATRPYYNFNVNLYFLFGFLVEVWYFCPDNQIEKIEVLKSNKVYTLFSRNVNIGSLNLRVDETDTF